MTRALSAFAILCAFFLHLTADANARPRQQRLSYDNDTTTIIGGRPAGCPHRYCGCGLRLFLGIDDPRLNLAANWPRYYRGNRMIAVWRHHVALVEEDLGGGMARLRDYNSGGGLSRVHVRSIARARIINGPSRVASR